MCRVLAYIGPEIPLESLLLKPENSLVNQSLDPERPPLLQLAGWGFGVWSEHLLKPDEPLLYRRPMAAFYDDNAERIIPSLQASTMLAHVRAADYNAATVLVDENCHPYAYAGTPWIMAQNGNLAHWTLLQRELLAPCKDEYLEQMRGTTDTEFLYVLLLSLLEGDSDDDVQRGFERLLEVVLQAMKSLDLVALTKLKIALVAPGRIVGVNFGAGHQGETEVTGDWRELRTSEAGSKDHALSMLWEPMYVITGRNFQDYEGTYELDAGDDGAPTSALFASEPLTDDTEEWLHVEFGEIVFLERTSSGISRSVRALQMP